MLQSGGRKESADNPRRFPYDLLENSSVNCVIEFESCFREPAIISADGSQSTSLSGVKLERYLTATPIHHRFTRKTYPGFSGKTICTICTGSFNKSGFEHF